MKRYINILLIVFCACVCINAQNINDFYITAEGVSIKYTYTLESGNDTTIYVHNSEIEVYENLMNQMSGFTMSDSLSTWFNSDGEATQSEIKFFIYLTDAVISHFNRSGESAGFYELTYSSYKLYDKEDAYIMSATPRELGTSDMLNNMAFSPTGFGCVINYAGGTFVPISDFDNALPSLPLMMNSSFNLSDFLNTVYDSNSLPLMHVVGMAINVSSVVAAQMNVPEGNFMFMFIPSQLKGNVYFRLAGSIDVTSQNVNSAALGSVNGLKIYLTGDVTNAFPGKSVEEDNSEGFIHLQGYEGESVDLYLDNFNIWSVQDRNTNMSFNDITAGYFPGGASAIAICPTREDVNNPGSVPFTANIHIKGENTIVGGNKRRLNSSGAINKIFSELLDLGSASISISPVVLHKADGQSEYESLLGKLVFDDVWNTSYLDPSQTINTGGTLNLPVQGEWNEDDPLPRDSSICYPSIDLGNARSQCVFNSGNYKLRCPASNSMFYVSSLSICYRYMDMLGNAIYGAGSSASRAQADSENSSDLIPEVVINGGHFSTYGTEVYGDPRYNIDVVSHGWYNDYTDMRLPYNSRINGGTFDCNVYVTDDATDGGCNPTNNAGEILCKDSNTGEYAHDDSCDDICSKYTRNWVTVIPTMGVNGLLTMGGSQEVRYITAATNPKPMENAYLFYCNLNDYTKEYGTINLSGLTAGIGQAIRMGGYDEFTEITNTENYTIQHGLYMMRSFETNKWYTLSMPFDVANIYVIETLPASDWKSGTKTDGTSYSSLEEYLQDQGLADATLAKTIVTSLCPSILSKRGYGVKLDLIKIIQNQLTNAAGQVAYYEPIYHYNPNWNGPLKEKHTSRKASFYLYEMSDLKEGDVDGYDNISMPYGFASWTKGDSIGAYSKKWTYATDRTEQVNQLYDEEATIDINGNVTGGNFSGRTTNYVYYDGITKQKSPITPPDGIVMQRGVTYSLYLPDGPQRYWDGKYLIFEGYGPQNILGKNSYKPLRPINEDDWEDDEAANYQFIMGDGVGMQANITFSNDTVDAKYPVFKPTRTVMNSTDRFDFVKTSGEEVFLPGEVYAVLSKEMTAIANSIATSGAISLDRTIEEEDKTTHAPNVDGGKSLFAWSDNGIYMKAFAEQLVTIYNLTGQQIFSENLKDGDDRYVNVDKGVYIIKGKTDVCKIVVE